MPANGYFATIVPNEVDWTPLAETRTVVDATVYVWKGAGTISAPLNICFEDQPAANVSYTWSFPLRQVDLSKIKVKGEGYYRVTVLGYTV